MPSLFSQKIHTLRGIGEKRAALFEKVGAPTIGDLLMLYPRSYIDLSQPLSIREAPPGETVVVRARVATPVRTAYIRKGMTLYKLTVTDGESDLELTFFNNRYIPHLLPEGREFLFRGKMTGSLLHRAMSSPEFYPADGSTTGLLPVYPQTEGLASRQIAQAVKTALSLLPDPLPDPLPSPLRRRCDLCTLRYALEKIHFPQSEEELAIARRRLIFEEFFLLQLGMLQLKRRARVENRLCCPMDGTGEFFASLPFSPTGAQVRCVKEGAADMAGPHPMNRLVQGDVGSGKTVVAAALCCQAAKNGLQAAFMAPTEILARQHFLSLQPLLQPLSVRCALLTGSTKAAERKQLLQELKNGDIHLLIGTHALLTGDVVFQKLGLVVTDEQHRFGVAQRAALAQKGDHPHLLVMSATPIPRTLALMIYGDLDLSLLDELPPGRQPIDTFLIESPKRERAFAFIRRHLDAGRQAYLICPLVEDNDSDMQSVTHYCEELKAGPFRDYTIGMLHGRMKPAEKDRIMADFSAGHTQILVSTTVVEVGVDVPNATIMLIENAERYGLSQLHQLRGRVGRGREKSTCILVSDAQNDQALRRLHVFTSTQSGFVIADEDLRLRGPGDFFGHKQHGLPALRIAQLGEDTDLLRLAQLEAGRLVREDADLSMPEHRTLRAQVRQLFARQETAMA